MELTLKRGSGLTFDGSNWNLASEKKWQVQVVFIPNGKEKHMGNRFFGGVEHAVFQCLNEEFFAQPISICKLPISKDPMEVQYSLEAPAEDEKPRPKTKQIVRTKVLSFAGKNWKLAADAKWKSDRRQQTNVFDTYDAKDKVGEKKIGQITYDVYKVSTGFIAVRQ